VKERVNAFAFFFYGSLTAPKHCQMYQSRTPETSKTKLPKPNFLRHIPYLRRSVFISNKSYNNLCNILTRRAIVDLLQAFVFY